MKETSDRKEDGVLDAPRKDGNVWPHQRCPAFVPRGGAVVKECKSCAYANFNSGESNASDVGMCRCSTQKNGSEISIAICDDLPEQSELISTAVMNYFAGHNAKTPGICVYNNPLLFLEGLKNTGGFDVLLLDICMPGLNGVAVAREIRNRKEKCEIVFLTTSDEFAVDAFSLKAAHYLLKPFTQAQFDEAMDRAMARFQSGSVRKIVLRPQGGGLQNIEVDEILYIESFGHMLNICLETGSTTESRRSLIRVLEMLEEVSPGQFGSPCKGYLVNQKAVRTIEPKQVILKNGMKIPIARGSFREFQERHFAFMFPDRGFL